MKIIKMVKFIIYTPLMSNLLFLFIVDHLCCVKWWRLTRNNAKIHKKDSHLLNTYC